MPIYEYQCQDCGHELEAIQKISAPLLTDCPACGEPALKKKISAVAFRLKGSGWYETDFKSDDKKRNVVKDDNAPPESKKSETAADGKTEGKSEKSEKSASKPESKSESSSKESGKKEASKSDSAKGGTKSVA